MPAAALLTAPRTLQLVHRERPRLAALEARVQVAQAGVCGTDIAIWSGAYDVPLPLVLGHEWTGRVVETGSAVDRHWLGRRVVAEINRHCAAEGHAEVCPLCAARMPTHCSRRTVTGIDRADGAFQQEIVLPVGTLVSLPDEITPVEAVFLEPLAAAIQTFRMTPVQPGDLVVVLGAGRLGLLVAFVAERLGTRVLAIARADGTLERARSFGIETARAGTNVRPRVLELTGGRGADVVVEATGTPAGLGAALALVRPCGTVALKSTPGQPVKHFDLTSVVVNEVRLQGSRCGSFPDALAFLPAHPMPLANLVTARLPLEEIGQAFERALEGGKVIVEVQ